MFGYRDGGILGSIRSGRHSSPSSSSLRPRRICTLSAQLVDLVGVETVECEIRELTAKVILGCHCGHGYSSVGVFRNMSAQLCRTWVVERSPYVFVLSWAL